MTTPKIFVLRSDSLGDVILTSGYLDSLVNSFPDHQVELWLVPETVSCAQVLHPRITVRRLPFDRFLRSGFAPVRPWLETVEAEKYAFGVFPSFTLWYPEIIALGYLDLGMRWGFPNRDLGVQPEWVYWELGPVKRAEADWIVGGPAVEPFSHEVDKYRALAQQQGLRSLDVEPRLFGVVAAGPSSDLLVWPGSSSEKRRWPARSFAAAVCSLAPAKVIIGAGPADSGPAEELFECLRESGMTSEICYRDPDRLRDTAQWLAGFRRVLSNDTGIAHLAAAAGAEVTAVSGSQHQGRFAVRGARSLTIFADVPCRQCGGLCIFENVPQPCVGDITAASVVGLMKRNQTGQHCLPEPATFVQPDRLFRLLVDASNRRAGLAERQLFEVESALRATRNQLHEAGRERDHWQAKYRAAESERDALSAAHQALLRESEDLRARLDRGGK